MQVIGIISDVVFELETLKKSECIMPHTLFMVLYPVKTNEHDITQELVEHD